jgi:hypothetical protein
MPDMEHKLEPWQEEIVEGELLDLFISLQEEIAAGLGIAPSADPGENLLWSDADAKRIMDEIVRQHRPLLMERFLDSATTA